MAVSKIANKSYLRDEEFTPTQATYTITYEQLKELIKYHDEAPKFGILTVDHINDLIVKVDKVYDWYLGACAAANKFKSDISGIVNVHGETSERPFETFMDDMYHLVGSLRSMADANAIGIGTVETALQVIESKFNRIPKIDETTDVTNEDKINQILDTLRTIDDIPNTEETPKPETTGRSPEPEKSSTEQIKEKLSEFRNNNK